jgi:hypothetical protein
LKAVKLSDAELVVALEAHVKNRWSIAQFTEATGLSNAQAGSILKGRYRKDVPRPEGFEHPWPETIGAHRTLTPEQIAEAFRRYQDERLSVRAFARILGVSKRAGWLIFHGYAYKDVERPEMALHHTPRGGRKKHVGPT